MATLESARTLSDYIAIARRRWWIMALFVALTVAVAAAFTFRQQPVYRASMKIVVGQGEGIFLPDFGNVADQFTQTMSELLETDIVANEVIDRLNLDMTSDELLERTSVVIQPSTAVLEVNYDDVDRDRGRRILEAVGNTFTELVDERLVSPAAGPAGLAVSATIFDPAHSLPAAISPNPKLNLAVSLVLGLGLGFVLALVRDHLDRAPHTVAQVEEIFGQPATATLPSLLIGHRPLAGGGRSRRKRVDPVLATMAADRLRAGIRWSPASRESRTFVVTSAGPDEGKSSVVSNLAVRMAEEGFDVIAVEADLRRPALHDYLGLPGDSGTAGLDAVIHGMAPLTDALLDVPLSRARALPDPTGAGAKRRPGRLRAIVTAPGRSQVTELPMDATSTIMNQLRGMAEVVLFDAPPLLVVTDPYPLVAAADTVVAVVRLGKATEETTRSMRRTLDLLREGRSVELVITGADREFGESYYDYALGSSARKADRAQTASREDERASGRPVDTAQA